MESQRTSKGIEIRLRPRRIAAVAALALSAIFAFGCLVWAWMAFDPGCRFGEVEWRREGQLVPRGEVCTGDLGVRTIRRDGGICQELFAFKDGLPVGEHCFGAQAR